MSQAVLTSHASVKTSQISVKVVKIDNRQMTLSVFRQLPVLDWKIAINYYPWGWVNYWHEPYDNGYIAAIFENSGQLFRSLIPPITTGCEALSALAWDEAEADVGEAYPGVYFSFRGGTFTIDARRKDSRPCSEATLYNLFKERRAFYEKEKYEPKSDRLKSTIDEINNIGQLFIAT